MRVLHVVTHMNRGGLETMIMNYYRSIDRDKVQFDFLVHRSLEADYDLEILNLGGKIHRISRLNPFSCKYKRELKNFFCEHPEYQVIHVHQDCMSSVILKVAKKMGVKVRIAHSHSASQDKNIKYLIKMFYRKKIAKYATDLLACGQQAGRWMFCGEDFCVLPNAVDAKKYRYDAGTGKQVRGELHLKDELVLGHIGRFNTVKNQMFLLDILKEYLKHSDNVHLILVGEGEERKEIENKARQQRLGKYITFTGVRTDVHRLLQAMDVFVFPSLYEGLPVTLVEAQAAGVPCVISDNISTECVLIDELVSALSLTESAQRWSDEVRTCINIQKKDRYEEICKAGYDIVNAAINLQNFYQQCEGR